MNVWAFTGNIGKDAEQRFTPNKDSVVTFSVAVKAGYGEKQTTTWARCVIWGKRGEALLDYLKKGQLVGVSGELSNREYEKDGSKHTSIEVRVHDLTLLGKSDGMKSTKPAERSAQPVDDLDDDLPF